MPSKKLVEKRGLPDLKTELTKEDRVALIEHCRKMVRDGATSQIYGVLNLAAALFNFKRFELYRDLNYDTYEDGAEAEFGFSKRHADKYALIGSQIALALGKDGSIIQRRLDELMNLRLFQTRMGFRQIHRLSKTNDGMQRLLSAKTEDDLGALIKDLKEGANQIQAEIDAKPKTELKAAMSKRFSASNPAAQTDLTVLFTATIRQLNEINTKYLKKLRDAVQSVYPEWQKQSKKYPAKAQQMWNEIRSLEELLGEIAEVYPDQVGEAQRVFDMVNANISTPVAPATKRHRRIEIPDVDYTDEDDVPQSDPEETARLMKSFDHPSIEDAI